MHTYKIDKEWDWGDVGFSCKRKTNLKISLQNTNVRKFAKTLDNEVDFRVNEWKDESRNLIYCNH